MKQTFRKTDRLLSPIEFKRVYDRKCSVSNAWIIVYALSNGLEHSRVGLSVSRKVGNAVVRNCFKRLVREAFRLRREKLPTGLDLIVLPRSISGLTLEVLQESLESLTRSVVQRLRRAEKR